jgi:putative ABC transport system permease protein
MNRLIRAAARLSLGCYPAAFRDSHRSAFDEFVEDRWRKERARHGAVFSTVRVVAWLVADTVQGRRALARTRPAIASRSLTIDRLFAHLRLAVRQLVRAPLVAGVATLSLAIGIGANTAVFTIANALFFAPLTGVVDPGRVLDVGRTTNGSGFDTTSYPLYQDLRAQATSLEGVYAMRGEPRPVSVGATDGAERAFGLDVSASYFDVLGTRAAAGGFFHSGDERLGTPLRRVVLSYAYWQRRYAGDPAIAGQPIIVNGDAFTIAGVAERGFQGTMIVNPDLWVPLTAYARSSPSDSLLRSRDSSWLIMGARVKAGWSVGQARSEIESFGGRIATAYPAIYQEPSHVLGLTAAPVSRLPGEFGEFVRPFVILLTVLVGLVLLVACANLSGLLLARAAARTRDVAVRQALGASRASLVSMFLVESLVLCLPGAAVGVVIATWTSRGVAAIAGQLPVPVLADASIDWRVLGFSALVTLATSLVTGLAPALRGSREDLVTELKSDASAPRRQRLRRLFVTAEMALCLVLLVTGALLVRALGAASRVDIGFQVDRVDVADLDLTLGGYPEERATAVVRDLRDRFRAIPGVDRVSAASVMPLEGDGMSLGALRRAGESASADTVHADWNAVTPDFLPELGLPIVAGRNFTDADGMDAPPVAIVNEQFARGFWPGADPIGRVLEFGDFRPGHEREIGRLTVIGVVRGAMARIVGGEPRPFIYVAMAQNPAKGVHFFLRRSPAAADLDLQPAVRAAVRDFDRNLPLVSFAPFSQYANLGLLPQRIAGSVAAALGAIALLLAAMGLYGVTAFAVTSRTREIGVRLALGADRARIARLVLGQGLRLVAVGAAIGGVAAAGLSQLLSSLLFGISPLDPPAFAITLGLLACVALAATWLPARRAAALDAAAALRNS